MTNTPITEHWFGDYANVVTLTAWLAENYASGDEVAHAVEKPWNYETEFRAAEAGLDRSMLDLLIEAVDVGDDAIFAALAVAGEACGPEWDFDVWLNEYVEMDEILAELEAE